MERNRLVMVKSDALTWTPSEWAPLSLALQVYGWWVKCSQYEVKYRDVSYSTRTHRLDTSEASSLESSFGKFNWKFPVLPLFREEMSNKEKAYHIVAYASDGTTGQEQESDELVV